jgi:hypothetical protein
MTDYKIDYNKVLLGCGDGNCVIQPPKGMHTNGGCKCAKYFITDVLDGYIDPNMAYLPLIRAFIKKGIEIRRLEKEIEELERLLGVNL